MTTTNQPAQDLQAMMKEVALSAILIFIPLSIKFIDWRGWAFNAQAGMLMLPFFY